MAMKQRDLAILYDDEFVTIHKNHGVIIKWYYFPIASSKTIPWKDIHSAAIAFDLDLGILEYKGWGMALSPIWWACDLGRTEMESIVLTTRSWPKSGFSTRNPGRVIQLIQENKLL